MRKFALLAAVAGMCVAMPAVAKSDNGKGSGQNNGNGQNNNGNGQGSGNNNPGTGDNHGNGGGASNNGGGNGGSAGNGGGSGGGSAGGSGSSGSGGSSGNGGSSGGSAGNNGGGKGASASQPVACNAATDLSIAALSCSGFYSGNLLDNNDVAAQLTGLTAIGVTWDGNFTGLDSAGMKKDLNGATEINFTQQFGTEAYGITVLGIHFGGGGPNGVGNGTAFYKFDAGTTGTNILALNYPGSSGIVLYSTGSPVVTPPPGDSTGAVPEPASWALMLGGFGLVGTALRRRRNVSFA